MARPIHADAEATRRRILAAANRLFSDSGIGSTSMRKIAGEAGVSVAMVHHYFGSKADLYRACVAGIYRELNELRSELEATFSGANNVDEVLEIAVRRTYRFAREHHSVVQLLMRTVLDTGALDPEHREQVQIPFLERGSALLASLLGRPIKDARLRLLSITYLVVRFALNTREEQARITMAPAAGVAGSNDEADPDSVVEDHLVAAARALLWMDGSKQ
jgi:AcrR family transcriptional regulator